MPPEPPPPSKLILAVRARPLATSASCTAPSCLVLLDRKETINRARAVSLCGVAATPLLDYLERLNFDSPREWCGMTFCKRCCGREGATAVTTCGLAIVGALLNLSHLPGAGLWHPGTCFLLVVVLNDGDQGSRSRYQHTAPATASAYGIAMARHATLPGT